MDSLKSSKTLTYLYYITYPLLIVIPAWVIYKIINYGDFSAFNIIILIVLFYGLIQATESLISLRLVEASEDGVHFGLFDTKNIIRYKDIYYTYSLVSLRASYGIVWYKDALNGKLKAILLRPTEITSQKSTGLKIINFIKERAQKENPNYMNINNERWFLFSISPTFKIFK